MRIESETADLPVESSVADRPGMLGRAAFAIGSAGLLLATTADALAVAGRHLGFRILGSIEIVQTSVVLVASSAMVAATIVGSHASVHIVTERLSAPTAARLARIVSLLAALTFLILAAGSIWVASDLWTGFEQTELLGISLRWFRALWIAAALLVAALFLRKALRR